MCIRDRTIPSLELQTITNLTSLPANQPWTPGELQVLKSNAWQIVDFGCNLTGFVGAKIACRSKTRLFLTFDEILSDGDVDFKRLGCVNIISYELQPGSYDLESDVYKRQEMGWYIARRIGFMVPVFVGATLLIYGMVFLLPGDPVAAMAGDRPLTPAVAAQLRARYHLDDPFFLQYLRYLGGVLHGDLGRSYSGLAVSEVLAHAFPVTLRLALIALAVEAVLGIGFGVAAGLRQGGIFDSTVLDVYKRQALGRAGGARGVEQE